MTAEWNPDTYEAFVDLRSKPFDDLVALIEPPNEGADVVDLGCGTGKLTASLADRLGAQSVLGIDNSAEMLQKSESVTDPRVRFEQGDINYFDRPRSFDVVLSNAALHWTDDHRATLTRWSNAVRAGGQLAVQLPANFAHPSHTVAAHLGQDSYFERRWRGGGPPADRGRFVLPPAAYAELLNELGFVEQSISLRVYPMLLESSRDVVDWVRGTMLVPYRAALAADDYAEFERRYAADLALAIGGETGERRPYFYGFDRILMWGRRSG